MGKWIPWSIVSECLAQGLETKCGHFVSKNYGVPIMGASRDASAEENILECLSYQLDSWKGLQTSYCLNTDNRMFELQTCHPSFPVRSIYSLNKYWFKARRDQPLCKVQGSSCPCLLEVLISQKQEDIRVTRFGGHRCTEACPQISNSRPVIGNGGSVATKSGSIRKW